MSYNQGVRGRKAFSVFVLFISLVEASLYAEFEFSGDVAITGNASYAFSMGSSYSLVGKTHLEGKYQSEYFALDIKGAYQINTQNRQSLPYGILYLDKAYFSVSSKMGRVGKLELSGGLMDVDWGKGSFFRVGDLLYIIPLSLEIDGTQKEKDIWAITLKEEFSNGIYLREAYALPFMTYWQYENGIDRDASRNRIAFLFGYKDDKSLLSEIKASYSYWFERLNRASLLFALKPKFNLTFGLESSFRNPSDFKIAVNADKTLTLSEKNGASLFLRAAFLLDLYNSIYSTEEEIALNFGAFLSLSLENVILWGDAPLSITETLEADFSLLDHLNISIEGGLSYSDKTPSIFGEVEFKAYF